LLPRFVASHVNPTSQQNLNLSEFADQPAPTALHPSATGLFIFLQGSANHSMPIGAAPWGGLLQSVFSAPARQSTPASLRRAATLKTLCIMWRWMLCCATDNGKHID
jgi:hypothetical protein